MHDERTETTRRLLRALELRIPPEPSDLLKLWDWLDADGRQGDSYDLARAVLTLMAELRPRRPASRVFHRVVEKAFG